MEPKTMQPCTSQHSDIHSDWRHFTGCEQLLPHPRLKGLFAVMSYCLPTMGSSIYPTSQMRTIRRVVSVSEDQILEDWGGGPPRFSPPPPLDSPIVNLPETYPSESELLTRTGCLKMAQETIRQHSGDCQTSWLVLNWFKDTSILA